MDAQRESEYFEGAEPICIHLEAPLTFLEHDTVVYITEVARQERGFSFAERSMDKLFRSCNQFNGTSSGP